MGIFSYPSDIFDFHETVSFRNKSGIEFSTISAVSNKNQNSLISFVFIHTRNRTNRYHLLSRDKLKLICNYLEEHAALADVAKVGQAGMAHHVSRVILSFIRGFVPKYGYSFYSTILLEDKEFNEFGTMSVVSNLGDAEKDILVMYSADEMIMSDCLCRNKIQEVAGKLGRILQNY